MSPDDFRESIISHLVPAWEKKCFCAIPAFRKLISFNFADYGIGPVGLVDSEMLIHEIIRQKFEKQGDTRSVQGKSIATFTCPQCKRICTDTYEDFSISMYRSYVTFDGDAPVTTGVLYLIGFFGFDGSDFAKINDFHKALTPNAFIDQFING